MPRTKKTKAQPADGTPPPAAKKPKLKKPMLMDSNEFTASRRRTIRAGQRELQREIMADGQKIEDVGDSAFDDLREVSPPIREARRSTLIAAPLTHN